MKHGLLQLVRPFFVLFIWVDLNHLFPSIGLNEQHRIGVAAFVIACQQTAMERARNGGERIL